MIMKAFDDAVQRGLTYAAEVHQRQFVFGSDVGFSAEWVCRRQGGEWNLGSIAIQAP
jgi:hypothetical protein